MNNVEQLKYKIMVEKIVKRVNELPAQEREEYIAKVKQELEFLQAKLKDREEYGEYLDEIPTEREMKGSAIRGSFGAHMIGGLVTGGLIGENFFPNDEIACTILGAILGFVMTIVNGVAYDSKPVSNKVNEFREYLNDKKIASLEEKIEKKEYIYNQLDEMGM